uniref:phage baseplate protein n=1 Tax=Anaerococcus mediterraneensis TaxID=1870984 RepID=UPI0009301F2F|nr:hypothetical protein [Anaerococcus mediterraneensis]
MQKLLVRLGDVKFDALVKENVDYDAELTSKEVEKGEDISDHMKTKPFTASLSGVMVEDADAKLEALKKYQKESELLTYIGKSSLESVVITSIQVEHTVENFNGYNLDIRIQEVRIASPETVKISVKNPQSGKQDSKTASRVKRPSDEGRKQVQSK